MEKKIAARDILWTSFVCKMTQQNLMVWSGCNLLRDKRFNRYNVMNVLTFIRHII